MGTLTKVADHDMVIKLKLNTVLDLNFRLKMVATSQSPTTIILILSEEK